jgi:PAS domain S-box-containing protein
MTNDRIQVVDDEHDFVTFLVKCLQRMEYVVADISTTGETAVAAAQRSKPDLVLMDICLLGAMDGIEAAARIRSQLNIPVVFLTGSDDEKTIQRAKISEPLGYLLKPFKPRELKTTIDSALYTFRASRDRAKEADRVAAERYRSLFENAIEGIFQAKLSGTVLTANAAAARMLGYESAEEILNSGVTLQTLLHIAPEKEIELTKRLNEQNTVEGYELEVVRKDGRKIVLSMNLRAVCDDLDAIAFVEGSAVDITARKQAEEKLIHEKQLMCALMDNLPDSIYFKDNQSRFVRISRAMAARIGLNDPELIVGKTDFDIFTEEHARAAYEDEQAILRTGCPLVNHEEEETWPDRPSTWVSTTKMPLRDEAGNVIGTFGISRDITKRKRAEKERA